MKTMSKHQTYISRISGGMVVRPWLKPTVQDFILIHPTAGHRRHRLEST